MYSIRERQEFDQKVYIRVDKDWVAQQLAEVGYAGTSNGAAVSKIVDLLASLDFKQTQVKDVDAVVSMALALFKGHPVAVDQDEKWLDVLPGDLQKQDTVRIKPDHYLGLVGNKHNGKRGRLISTRNGRYTVVYDGQSADEASIHEISALQKLDVK